MKICDKCNSTMPYDPYFKAYICRQCGNQIEHYPTNYDRIQAMSVEEMAKFLEAETYDSCEHTASWYTEWLNSPAEVEG